MACKPCRQRKVRCDGRQTIPCRQCVKHDLDCTFEAPRHRSRLGAANRGDVIAHYNSSALSSAPLHSDGFFYYLIPRFMTYIYPICPVISEDEIRYHIRQRLVNDVSAVLCYTWAGIVVFQERCSTPLDHGNTVDQVSELVQLALKHHRPLGDEPLLLSRPICCMFLASCMIITHKMEKAFYHLREAITLTQLLQFNRQDVEVDENQLKIVYWMCFLNERTLALLIKTPICMDPLQSFPALSPSSLDLFFQATIRTFLHVDRDMVSALKNDGSTEVTEKWIEQKHQELMDKSWFSDITQLSNAQQADLTTTRQWICTLLWQIAVSTVKLTSSAASSDALSLAKPLDISAQVRPILARTKPSDMITHAFSLAYSLFEITTTIADVLLHIPPCEDEHENQRRLDDFSFVMDFLYSMPNVKPVHKDVLTDRVYRIKSKYGLT